MAYRSLIAPFFIFLFLHFFCYPLGQAEVSSGYPQNQKATLQNSRLGFSTNPNRNLPQQVGIYGRNPFGLTGRNLFPRTSARMGLTSKSISLDSGLQCLSDIGQGVWNSTGGVVELAGQIIRDPAAAWDQGAEVFEGMKQFLADIENELLAAYDGLHQLSPEILSTLVCTAVGEIGTDAIITVLSGGGGTGKLAANVALKLKKVSSLTKLLDVMNSLRGASMRRANELLKKFISSNKVLDRQTTSDVDIFSENKMPELAMDRLECAL
jgi:hypothetical protein